MAQDFAVGVAFGCHHCGSYLAQAYSVTPAGSLQNESVLSLFNYERTAEQMALRECAAYLKFLADGDGLFCTLNLQFIYSARWSALDGAQVNNITYIQT